MMNSVELQTSNDILKDLLALLNMYKATEGMIERFNCFNFDNQSMVEWIDTKERYHEAVLTLYDSQSLNMTTDDKNIFLTQSKGYINIF